MADFAHWISACENGLWPAGSFSYAYRLNRRRAVDEVVQLDSLANAIQQFMQTRNAWTGTATELVRVLNEDLQFASGVDILRLNSPRAVAGRLRRAAPFLREVGVGVAFFRTGPLRLIGLSRTRSEENSTKSRGEFCVRIVRALRTILNLLDEETACQALDPQKFPP
jgi:hypothetical protein